MNASSKTCQASSMWHRGLRHYKASLQIRVRSRAVSPPAAPRSTMRRHTIGPASSGLGEGLAGRDVLVPLPSSNSCGGSGTCTLTRSLGVQCFLRHIGAAGFRVKRALCQEAVRLGWVVFRRMHGSRPVPLTIPYGSCSDGL